MQKYVQATIDGRIYHRKTAVFFSLCYYLSSAIYYLMAWEVDVALGDLVLKLMCYLEELRVLVVKI